MINDPFHDVERFLADMMLDPFAIDFGGLWADAELFQERLDDFMAFSRRCCKSLAFRRQLDRLIRFRRY